MLLSYPWTGARLSRTALSSSAFQSPKHLLFHGAAHYVNRPFVTRLSLFELGCGTRGKKTKTSLPIGLEISPETTHALPPLLSEDGPLVYPTVVLQARNNMRKFENCILLTRVGGFYEMYFEHADEFGPLLNLKVAQKRTSAGAVSMAGFPFFQLERYLKMLVQDLHRYVAIAEEFPNDPSDRIKSGALMHDRRVARIITPGTLIDENFMDPLTNNYVLAIHAETIEDRASDPSSVLGLAWLDLSTGHFFTQSTTLAALPSLLARIGPREVVVDEKLQPIKDHSIFSVLEDEILTSFVDTSQLKPITEWSDALESPIPAREIDQFTTEEIAAGASLLKYIETRLQGSNMKLQPPARQLNVMEIDRSTLRALEIKTTIRDDLFRGSLLHSIRRTVTKGGARLLDTWLTSPSVSLLAINARLDMVTHLLKSESLRERLIGLFKRSHDSHRLLQKFAFGRGDADDLLALASTIRASEEIITVLSKDTPSSSCVQAMVSRIELDGPSDLATRIKEAIDEEGVVEQHRIVDGEVGHMQALAEATVMTEGSQEDSVILPKRHLKKKPTSIRDHYSESNDAWIMRPVATPVLQALHQDLAALAKEKESLTADLCMRLGVSSLTLRFTPGLGHICHVKGKDIKRDLAEVKSVSSSKSTRSFHHPEWTQLGQTIDQCKVHIRAAEQQLFNELREQVILNIIKLRRNAAVLDELDVACSFATLAAEKEWTRPILNEGSAHKIVAGRHPTVEGGLEEDGRSFITNDCFVGDSQRIWLITGPNMAGKSTFLRQNALITILAQVGSYVPATYAELGIVDQIFSRVGSADSVHKDQSTFMVEMLETATILRNATSRSFVIMDEIGRGTTPEDGTAVAFACLHHLYHINKSRVLFATHFHDLADRVEEKEMKEIGFYCTDVEELGGEGKGFRYVHRLRQGVNRKSHALKVARLAGLPEEAILAAKEFSESR